MVDQGGYFQIEEIVLVEGEKVDVKNTMTRQDGVAYNGVKPVNPDTPDTPDTPDVPETGDVVVIASLLSAISLAGTAFVSKKRR